MSVEQEQQAKQALSILDELKELKRQLVESVETVKNSKLVDRSDLTPEGWSNTTNAPYYKAEFAQELAYWLKKLIEEKDKDIVFDENVLIKLHVSRNTLCQRFTQAFMFLMEKQDNDPPGFWRELRAKVEFLRPKNTKTLVLTWKHKPSTCKFLTEEDGKIVESAPLAEATKERSVVKWKKDFNEYIENAQENEVFKKTGLNLSEQDMGDIQTSLAGLEDFHIVKLKPHEIFIIRNSRMRTIAETGESNANQNNEGT